jgi:hypothetical protein
MSRKPSAKSKSSGKKSTRSTGHGRAIPTGPLPRRPLSGLPEEPRWYDAKQLTISGKGWKRGSRTYERLPSRAEERIPRKPWKQSLASAGISIRFQSNASMLYARWVDYNNEWAINQASANQLSLFVRVNGKWRWLGLGKQQKEGNSPTLRLINDTIPSMDREYLLYLPQGRGIRHLEIGIPKGAKLRSSPPQAGRPILFYGTSIIQGATAASRPGNNLVALIERHFDYPVINLGFSGSGCMEPEVIDFVAEIDACVYVIDCLPNMVEETVRERFVPAVHSLRKARPRTPIVVVESLIYEDGFLVESRRSRCEGSNAALREGYKRLIKEGVKGLTYVPGESLFGGESEVTRDGTHPTDFGYRCTARVFTKLLAPYLERRKKSRGKN